MSVNADGKYLVTLADGRKVLVDAAVTVDGSGVPSTGGSGGFEGSFITASLTDDGTGEGDSAANKDYSGAPGRVYLTVPTGYRLDVYAIRMIGTVSSSVTNVTGFFNLTALTTGIDIASTSGDGVDTRSTLYRSAELKSNAGWAAKSNNYLMTLVGSSPIVGFFRTLTSPLSIAAGDCMNVGLYDDLTGLTGLVFEIEGRLIPV